MSAPAPTAVVSHAYWTQYLGSSPQLSSFALRIENRVYAVVGVMPAGFQFPSKVDLWVPTELDAGESQPHVSQLLRPSAGCATA